MVSLKFFANSSGNEIMVQQTILGAAFCGSPCHGLCTATEAALYEFSRSCQSGLATLPFREFLLIAIQGILIKIVNAWIAAALAAFPRFGRARWMRSVIGGSAGQGHGLTHSLRAAGSW